jgi:hypothetical protein
MDSIDRLLDALDYYRTARGRIPKQQGQSFKRVPNEHAQWHAEKMQAEADEAKTGLREALRAAVVEVVREDYRSGGELRDILRTVGENDV